MKSTVSSASAVLALALLLAACNNGPSYANRGTAQPTVEGGGARTAYPDLAAARSAFTRQGGAMTATLEDAAWIRLEPDTAGAAERHPEYFAGLTTFQVVLLTEHFARPTQEEYLLEDSTGVKVTSKPESYKGDLKTGFGPRNAASFKVVFQHTMSKSIRWLKLTREGEGGGTVSWDFPGCETGVR